jgi:dipeptidyl aminopeptidase/acylaminoacyl peptidase
MTTAPYGSWPSPVTADLIVEASVSLGGPAFGGGDLWWSELRPAEGGRVQIVRKPLDGDPGSARDVLPEGFSARTRVHEYGGGAWWLHGETLFFVNWDDQRIYRLDPTAGSGAPVAITPEPSARHALRYADGRVTPDGRWIICVRETHGDGETRNQLVALPAAGSSEPTVLVGAEGDVAAPDFVSSPCIHPDGGQLRWVQWNHPDMPWDRTVVGRGKLVERDGRLVLEGARARDKRVQSSVQPAYGPDGNPYSICDISGWWRIWLDGLVPRPIVPEGIDWAEPAWVFGQSSYAFTSDGRGIVAVGRSQGRDRLYWLSSEGDGAAGGISSWMGVIETKVKKAGTWTAPVEIDLPFTAIDGVTAGPDGTVAFIAATFTGEPEVVTIDTAAAGLGGPNAEAADGPPAVTVHRPARDLGLGADWVSEPEHISYLTTGGETAYGLFYPPANPDVSGPEGTLPPLVVLSHGGPTAAARPQLNLAVQFWTTRGFAVVDVNYRGSTGYGRRYREMLNGQWGIVDVDDCRMAARALAEVGAVDGDRLVIRGGSAGGYTTLRVLTTGADFAAGASLYGVADLEALARDTHKFEARYLDSLVGPYPEARQTYVERSPIHHVDRLSTPLIILQGLDDEIVPPAQAETMVAALHDNKVPYAYLTFAGEDHGFRQAASIRRALQAELYFYGRVLGFEPADELEPVPIEFL